MCLKYDNRQLPITRRIGNDNYHDSFTDIKIRKLKVESSASLTVNKKKKDTNAKVSNFNPFIRNGSKVATVLFNEEKTS